MNANRIITTLANVKRQLQRKEYCSPEQLRVLRKARAKWQKRLDSIINTPSPTHQVKKHTPQLPLGFVLVLGVLLISCQRSKVVEPESLHDVQLVATIKNSNAGTVRVYKINNTPCYVTVDPNGSSISCTSNP